MILIVFSNYSATQAKNYADAEFIKPHSSKAQLSLLSVASPTDITLETTCEYYS